MAFTYTIDSNFLNTPGATDAPKSTHTYFQVAKKAFRERMEVEHEWDITGTQTNHGLHLQGSAHPTYDNLEPTTTAEGLIHVGSGRTRLMVADGSEWHRSWYDATNERFHLSLLTAYTRLDGDVTYEQSVLAGNVDVDRLKIESSGRIAYGSETPWAIKQIEDEVWTPSSSSTKTITTGITAGKILGITGVLFDSSLDGYFPIPCTNYWVDDGYASGNIRLKASVYSGVGRTSGELTIKLVIFYDAS